ncbi:hypothetical protein LJR129_004467 [Acidovorax sp. LjRoot129]|uniref:hypothetical protein n=1 Tax=Acidovorax sp. LjRoot129 TaxID=3342260 RepID=UPI003ECC5FC9
MRDRDGHVRRWRLAGAVAVALAIHGALLVAWVSPGWRGTRTARPSPAPSAAAMQWVTPIPQSPTRHAAAAAVAQAEPRRTTADMAPARRTAVREPRAADEPTPVTSAGSVIARDDGGAAPNALTATAPAPLPPASGAQPSAPAAAVGDTDGIARALRDERAWQRRHGAPAWGGPIASAEGPAPGLSGGSVSVRESVGADGSRVARVQGPAGSYCVRVPSANRLPDVGAAPRVAPVTNCP